MKKFFSLEYFKELKILLILDCILILLASMLVSIAKDPINVFNVYALIITLLIWIISSIFDRKNYFNFFTLIAISPITYFIFYIMLNI